METQTNATQSPRATRRLRHRCNRVNNDKSDNPSAVAGRRAVLLSRSRPTAGRRAPLIAVIVLVGLLLSAGSAWTAWRLDRGNERHLLQLQTRQAASLVQSAIGVIQSQLQTVATVATVTGGDGAEFTRFMAGDVGAGRPFDAAALWRIDGSQPTLVGSIGIAPALQQNSAAARAFITLATSTPTFAVASLTAGDGKRIGYALADHVSHRFAVYAERTIPASRRVPIESGSAFADLHFATYLGTATTDAALQTTDMPDNRLPLTGTTAREVIGFGNTSLTLVTSPAGHLGGGLGVRLPWIFLLGGCALTAAAALVAGQLVSRRGKAEADSATISTLYAELDGLYGEQRSIAETLQNALLPQRNPTADNLEVATRYVAGARGVEIGGDWYSLIIVDEAHFGFVVGDVSGRGVDAAALMARIRFTLRAYLVEGHPPDKALELCARQVDITADGHIVTALVGLGELATGRITLANAGHLSPLLLHAGRAEYLPTHVGLPLGVTASTYRTTTVMVPPGAVLLAFTDGLVERRGEDLGVGLGRLAQAAAPAGPVDELLTNVLAAMNDETSEDDVAILAFRWQPVGSPGQPLDTDDQGSLAPSV